MAKRDREHPIPEDYAEMIGELSENEFYIQAWNYALDKGNIGPKACMVFADAHWQDFQPGGVYGPPKKETPEDLQAEIDKLTAQKDRLEQSGN